MGKVTVIEAKRKTPAAKTTLEQRHKIRVAAYARVSTDHTDQETSYEAQQTHFKSLIENNPDWELVGIYADEESGTSADKRENFKRMIADCEAGKIQMVLTKSISRFARNTLDALNYIRRLKARNIPILFTKESINTMDAGGEVLVTILASIAQQESASISQNVQIGVRYHYQEGRVCSGVHKLLGYKRTPDGSLELVPEEAWIIRWIFREFLDGYTMKHIADRLIADKVDGTRYTENGIEVPRKWNYEGISYILENEKYSGDLLLQKFYTVDFLTKTTARNEGQVPQYLAENNHEPVVPKSIFLQVQAEIERRRKEPINYNHHYPLSGRMECGECGTPYRRVRDKRYGTANWRCDTRVRRYKYPGIACRNEGVGEKTVQAAVVKAFNLLPEKEAELIRLDERLKWAGIQRADRMLAEIREKMPEAESAELPDVDRIDGMADPDELKQQYEEVYMQRAVYMEKEICIRNLLQRIRAIKGEDNGMRDGDDVGGCSDEDTFYEITRAFYEPGEVTEFSGEEAMRFIEKIIVEDQKFIVRFKAGVNVEIPR